MVAASHISGRSIPYKLLILTGGADETRTRDLLRDSSPDDVTWDDKE